MKESYVVLLILLSTGARSNKILTTNVVSFAFCESNLLPKDKMEDLHMYAELKDDPHANLPDSFTVCSNIMITGCLSTGWPVFFNILDNNRSQYLGPQLKSGTLLKRGPDLWTTV